MIEYRNQPDFILRVFSRTNVVVYLMVYYYFLCISFLKMEIFHTMGWKFGWLNVEFQVFNTGSMLETSVEYSCHSLDEDNNFPSGNF